MAQPHENTTDRVLLATPTQGKPPRKALVAAKEQLERPTQAAVRAPRAVVEAQVVLGCRELAQAPVGAPKAAI